MDKKIFMALSMLFMVFVGFQFTAPVSAVKVVDHGALNMDMMVCMVGEIKMDNLPVQ